MKIQYQQQTIRMKDGETVLAALLRQGLPVRYSCRAGTCHTCMLRASAGRIPVSAQRGLRADLAEQGCFLPCLCVPEEPLAIEQPRAERLAISCPVIEAFMLTDDIRCIRLAAHAELATLPGQHLGVIGPGGRTRRYSVASLPQGDGRVELHVRRIPGGRVSAWLVDEVRVGNRLEVLPPAGDLLLPRGESRNGLLLVATGTGLAPMMALLRQALTDAGTYPIRLLHGVSTPGDLYADSWLQTLAAMHPRFHYQACCRRGRASVHHYPGRVTEWLEQNWPALDRPDVRVAGNPAMVEEVIRWCRRQAGGQSLDIRSDPFHPADASGPGRSRLQAGERRAPPPDPALWSRLANGRILREVLRDFYDLAFEDERLGPYFADVTRQRLREKQYSFLRSLILGRRDYMGQRPRNAHHWMVISDDLFDYRLRMMEDCMRDHGLTETWIRRWHVFEEFFRADIVKSEPLPRRIGGQEVTLDGMEDARLEDGGVCDGCQRIIECGEPVRFHLRLGAVYCQACSSVAVTDP